MLTIPRILELGPVMPVIVIDDSDKAVPLAEALLEGGIRTIEITLRTPAALDAALASGNEWLDGKSVTAWYRAKQLLGL